MIVAAHQGKEQASRRGITFYFHLLICIGRSRLRRVRGVADDFATVRQRRVEHGGRSTSRHAFALAQLRRKVPAFADSADNVYDFPEEIVVGGWHLIRGLVF